MSALVEARGLTKHFPLGRGRTVHAVDDVSLAIAPREIVGLVGESGSGKSTFGKALVGLHDKTAGDVYLEGEKLPRRYAAADFQRYARRMQMIFQDPYSSLNPRMTVGEIIAEGPRLNSGIGGRKGRGEIGAWLERVGLDPGYAARYPHELSGGQRQRVGIARALSVEPELVVCDEPVSALDVSVQAQVLNLLSALRRRRGLTYLFIAHDLAVVRHVAHRVAVMYLGKIVETASAAEIYTAPRHPYTQALISAIPVPNPGQERKGVVLEGDVPSPLDPPSGCRFRERCRYAQPDCAAREPVLESVGGGHTVACHHWRHLRVRTDRPEPSDGHLD